MYVKHLHRRQRARCRRRRRHRDLGAQPISLKRTVRWWSAVYAREHRVIDLFNWSETRVRPRRRHFAISIDSVSPSPPRSHCFADDAKTRIILYTPPPPLRLHNPSASRISYYYRYSYHYCNFHYFEPETIRWGIRACSGVICNSCICLEFSCPKVGTS